MTTEIVVTDNFRDWYETLSAAEQKDVRHVVNLLIEAGAALNFPYSSGVSGSKYSAMRELRIQHGGEPYRVLYAFDPVRQAVLLVGGNKTGKGRWYEQAVRLADKLWGEYLGSIRLSNPSSAKRDTR